jgi:ubiquinol oxidase
MTEHYTHLPKTVSDKIAKKITMILRWIADTFFMKQYGHRAVVLETIAAVPGMVGGMWIHLKSLRQMKTGYGPKIRMLLAEAENERMHLMTFIEIVRPNWFERILVLVAQGIFWHVYLVVFIFFPRTAHRIVGYFEEEAVISYTDYLEQVDANPELNVAAPKLAIDYWRLPADARLRDVIIAVRHDEMEHSRVNHAYADEKDH